jgi:hypothetical protein
MWKTRPAKAVGLIDILKRTRRLISMLLLSIVLSSSLAVLSAERADGWLKHNDFSLRFSTYHLLARLPSCSPFIHKSGQQRPVMSDTSSPSRPPNVRRLTSRILSAPDRSPGRTFALCEFYG